MEGCEGIRRHGFQEEEQEGEEGEEGEEQVEEKEVEARAVFVFVVFLGFGIGEQRRGPSAPRGEDGQEARRAAEAGRDRGVHRQREPLRRR